MQCREVNSCTCRLPTRFLYSGYHFTVSRIEVIYNVIQLDTRIHQYVHTPVTSCLLNTNYIYRTLLPSVAQTISLLVSRSCPCQLARLWSRPSRSRSLPLSRCSIHIIRIYFSSSIRSTQLSNPYLVWFGFEPANIKPKEWVMSLLLYLGGNSTNSTTVPKPSVPITASLCGLLGRP